MFLAISQPILDRFLWFKDRELGKNSVSKVQHMTGQKTGCNRSRPVFFGFSIFQQMSQLATKKFQNLCNCSWWSGLLQLGSVWFQSFFQSSKLDLQTLLALAFSVHIWSGQNYACHAQQTKNWNSLNSKCNSSPVCSIFCIWSRAIF